MKGAGFVPRESVFRCLAHGLSLPVSPMYLGNLYRPWLTHQQDGASRHLHDAKLCLELVDHSLQGYAMSR